MEGTHQQRSSPSERYIGFFSSPAGTLTPANGGGGGGIELDEEEVLWTGGDPPSSPDLHPRPAMTLPSSPRMAFRRLSEKSYGILAALPEEDAAAPPRNPSFLRRTGSSLSAASSASSSSPSSSRMIPVAPPRQLVSDVVQSAPVNVPAGRGRVRREERARHGDGGGGEENEALPPHEMVARKESPMTTFSVLEGAGRTLKGRDLRRVRNAVWRQTGFIE